MLTENHLTHVQRSALSAAGQPHGTSAPRQACDADSAYVAPSPRYMPGMERRDPPLV